MIKLIAFAAFALAITASAQAMTVAPVHEPDGMITRVAMACGAGMKLMVSAWPERPFATNAGANAFKPVFLTSMAVGPAHVPSKI
jgi:hypothetical protein